ncbi:MAG: AraC family transcriptional regulator [Propionibacteriaceae bacterium]|jgi:AraC-like DNA-binding protein|nr:AraC family transcriptional regulator [Propionibacteriaceae bacterium]
MNEAWKAAADLAAVAQMDAAAFSFRERSLTCTDGHYCSTSCPLAASGKCDFHMFFQFGCFEAERWGGRYISYCPSGLTFSSAIVYSKLEANLGLVFGPVVLGELSDMRWDMGEDFVPVLRQLPSRSATELGALSRVQDSLCKHMSDPDSVPAEIPSTEVEEPEPEAEVQALPHYPFEVENRLISMIQKGDRTGASELINQLLASLYLVADGDFPKLRKRATELVTLFSRSAIYAGADSIAIFGEIHSLERRLASCSDIEAISAVLVSLFNRFVGYVFDFSSFQHANAIQKAVEYIRAHYAERLTLAGVSAQVWMSPSYFSTVFAAEMGMNLTAYIQSVRVEIGKELLAQTHMTIAQIAAETGFADQSYFTKVFTKAVGISPTAYRRKGM